MMIPVNLERQLVPGSLEDAQRAGGERYKWSCPLDNEMDLSGFEEHFKNDQEGRPVYDPRILLKG